MNFNEYKEIIKPKMSEKRYIHSVNVAKQAKHLAKIYGVEEEKALTAGILHDIAKEMPTEEQLQIITNSGIILDNIQQRAMKLWHSITGSIYVKEVLGIEDEDIINAIRFHTTGRANMSMLEKIIFIADFTSAERDFKGVATMRKKADKNLDDAMLYGFKFTFCDLTKRNLAIHPDELNCYNEIILK